LKPAAKIGQHPAFTRFSARANPEGGGERESGIGVEAAGRTAEQHDLAACEMVEPIMVAKHQTARNPTGHDRKARMARVAEAKRRRRLTRTTIALALLIGGSGLAIAHQIMRLTDRQQAIADDAALAGLHALVGADQRINLSKFEVASNAAHRVAQSEGVAPASVTPFAEGASFSVTLIPPQSSREVTATARYVRPGQRMSEAMGESLVARLQGVE
jgi:hypothetical protein